MLTYELLPHMGNSCIYSIKVVSVSYFTVIFFERLWDSFKCLYCHQRFCSCSILVYSFDNSQ